MIADPTHRTGAERAAHNTDPWWRNVALSALAFLAEQGRPFTADDLHDLGVPRPDVPQRIGGVFAAAHREGWIRPVGFHVSNRPSRAQGLMRQWIGCAPSGQEGSR